MSLISWIHWNKSMFKAATTYSVLKFKRRQSVLIFRLLQTCVSLPCSSSSRSRPFSSDTKIKMTKINQTHSLNCVSNGLFNTYSLKVKDYDGKDIPIIHHDNYVCDFPENHRFCMRKFHGVINHLLQDQVIKQSQVVLPDKITSELCELVHDPDYIHRFFNGLTSEKEQKLSGFQWSPGIVSRCRYESGGTLLGCLLALERGIGCSTGGGTHHAFHGHGSGYCLINDMAIAAASVIQQTTVQKVLIVDLDVHQGDGTASIMKNNGSIFTLSMHCQSNFPFRKESSDLDIGLKDHVEDEEYLTELKNCLPWVLDSFRPDLVIYDAGVDVHVKDELGRLDLTDKGIFNRDTYVLSTLKKRGIPVMTVIGGGYCKSLERLSIRHTIVHRAATKLWKQDHSSSIHGS